ncbi:MAG: MotA/TolQ/ExbB proton channel family protein [Candidatus Latescibacteria bacterium]|nr:MotA/TolQ/ExbB proton channel family protein [Candidatus Latescibacterota bacterium]
MNPSTILGIIVAVALLILTVLLDPAELSLRPGAEVYYGPDGIESLAIVLIGTLAATFISYPMQEVLRVFRVFLIVFKKEEVQVGEQVSQIVGLARAASTGGIHGIEGQMGRIRNLFMRDGVQMLIDNYPLDTIRELMEARIVSRQMREDAEAGVFKTMGKFAPAFGMLGTLIGLIAMLRNMTGPNMMEQLGPGMAVALVTTFYGVILANLLFAPIATKLERRTEEEIALMNVIMEGVLMLRETHSPSMIEDKLKSYIPPGQWQTNKALGYAEGGGGGQPSAGRRPPVRPPVR